MRRLSIALLCALLGSAMLAPTTGHATVIQGVWMRDTNPDIAPVPNHHVPRYDPRALLSTPGWQVRWYHDDTGTAESHTVSAYHGASFESPAIAPGSSWQTGYAGGTVLYRCLYHSSLDDRVTPAACDGMCGAIHDATADTASPTAAITTPNGFVFSGPVRIDGTASDNRAVISVKVTLRPIVEAGPLTRKQIVSSWGDAMNPCVGCNGPSVKWTVRHDAAIVTRAPVVTLPPGQYRVEAEATDPHGNVGVAAPIVIYVVR